MGLDISIRWVRQGAKKTVPEKQWDGTIAYKYEDKDVRIFDAEWLQGRSEFSTIRDWVRNDRYGQYIPLVGEDYKTLIKMIEDELHARVEKEETRRKLYPELYDDYNDFPWYLGTEYACGLDRLYGVVLKAPLYEEKGWIMELECDW